MRGWSIPLGRWVGVELRVHVFFPMLVFVCLALDGTAGSARAIGLFLALVAAVAVRETMRLLTAAWFGLQLRAILLLPIGGLFAWANPESQEGATKGTAQFALAFAGPLANLFTGLMMGVTLLGASSGVPLFAGPMLSAMHLLRAAFWMQLMLGAIHLLPAYPLDGGRLLRSDFSRRHGLHSAARITTWSGQILALVAMIAGGFYHSPWLAIAGFFIMIGAQVEDQGVFFQSVVDTVLMREVMLTDFATLSASDTLTDALTRCVHSLQDDFPVVRGNQLVGIVNRQSIVEALREEGNGYIQSVMSRAFQVAGPEDTLGKMIRRISAGRGLALIPVAESGRVVGIVSVQNLMSAMSLLAEKRRLEQIENEE